MVTAYLDTAPFERWPGFPWHGFQLKFWLEALRERAIEGPCSKSKRGAMLLDNGFVTMQVNGPPGKRICTRDAVCRAACSQICVHAEERALSVWLRGWVSSKPPTGAHVIHVAVNASGQPRSKGTPSCVTCSRSMLDAGVETVWLFGGEPAAWRGWTAEDFHAETLKNLSLPDSLREECSHG